MRNFIEIPKEQIRDLKKYYIFKNKNEWIIIKPVYCGDIKKDINSWEYDKVSTNGKIQSWLYGYDELSDKRGHYRLFGAETRTSNKDEAKSIIKVLEDSLNIVNIGYVEEYFFNGDAKLKILKSEGNEVKIVTKDNISDDIIGKAVINVEIDELEEILELYELGLTPDMMVDGALRELNKTRTKNLSPLTVDDIMENLCLTYDYFLSDRSMDWYDFKNSAYSVSVLDGADFSSEEFLDRAIKRLLILSNADWVHLAITDGGFDEDYVRQRIDEEMETIK